MICPYCKEQQINSPKISDKNVGVSICVKCQCLFRFTMPNEEIIFTQFMLELNDMAYWILLDYAKNKTIIKCPASPALERRLKKGEWATHAIPQFWSTLKEFNHIIDINPNSALNKLKLILSFL